MLLELRKLTPFLWNLFVILTAIGMSWSDANAQIIDDGAIHGVDAVGTYSDLSLPMNSQIKSITFSLVGGDGGYAQVKDSYINPLPPFNTIQVTFKSDGGNGATVIPTFPVGTGPNEIPLGSTIRFVEGARGQNGSSLGVLGTGLDYGGGGGGSAVLFDPPGPQGWTLLAVAGGGGGAYQGMFAYSAVDSENGQGGRVGTSGGSGNGDLGAGSGGGNGSGGVGSEIAGAGGGRNSAGGGVTCIGFSGTTTAGEGGAGGISSGYGGMSDGCVSFTWRTGGPGFGGGGAGAGAGGGGGGYSGGGAGGTTGHGGGGGSFVAPGFAIITGSIGGTDGTPDHGSITYQVTLNQPPIALCKNATIYLDGSGNASVSTADIDNGSSDPDGTITSMSLSKTAFTCADVGPNQVTLTVVDDNGATDNCQGTVTVIDTISPSVVCQSITVYLDDAGHASITGNDVDGGSADNCAIASLSVSPSSFTCADVGPNMVELTVTDVNGNSSSCTTTVFVRDTVSPIAECQNITVQLDASGNASISGNDIDGGSTDNCAIASFSAFPSSFTCADVGPNVVELTVTDVNGNSSVCHATVTVEDNVPPMVITMDLSVNLDKDGKVSIVAMDVDNGSSDACGIDTMYLDIYDFTCADLGSNEVELTVMDVNGNTASETATVTVNDVMKPRVKVQDVTVVLDKYGEASVQPADLDAGSWDNCTIVGRWLEGLTTYDCDDVGTHPITLYVEDQSGNVNKMTAQVTVEYYEPDFTNIHGVANGDTVHLVDCLPWPIDKNDLVHYRNILDHGTIYTHLYAEELPDNPPWSMYELYRYEYRVKDACDNEWNFTFYLALYDLAPPGFHSFPNDTIVATMDDVPEVDEDVRIIDICQHVVWDTVVTMPVLNISMTDTIGFTRRWLARDPVGHESFRDQMIWIASGDRSEYGVITGRIANEDHIINARFAGEAGTNGLPVSLYRIDETQDSLIWVANWTTGDWQGAQGKYYFVLEHPGRYRVKIDSAICLVDTLKFDKYLWSDTLEVSPGEVIDQGWIITHPCTDTNYVAVENHPTEISGSHASPIRPTVISTPLDGNVGWTIYPNPATGYVRINIKAEDALNFRVYDALGRMVRMGHFHPGQTKEIRNLNTGLFYIQLMDKDRILGTRKVLIIE